MSAYIKIVPYCNIAVHFQILSFSFCKHKMRFTTLFLYNFFRKGDCRGSPIRRAFRAVKIRLHVSHLVCKINKPRPTGQYFVMPLQFVAYGIISIILIAFMNKVNRQLVVNIFLSASTFDYAIFMSRTKCIYCENGKFNFKNSWKF